MLRFVLIALAGFATPVHPASYPAAPAIHGDVWLNSAPLTARQMQGKVVLVEFWTFGCWNCRNVEPHVKQWHADYADDGLLVVAVHSPEFSHEAELSNVQHYVKANDIRYPVPVDNEFITWKRFGNRAWPALYLIDKKGRVRYSHVGEGAYGETERAIRKLLAEPSAAPAGQ